MIIYRACGHLKELEDESIRDIKKLLELKKNKASLIVWGCLPKINPASLTEFYDGPLIGPEEIWDFLSNFFPLPQNKETVHANLLNKHYIPKQTNNDQPIQKESELNLNNYFISQLRRLFFFRKKKILQNTWYIKILTGCKNNCTFCSDRLVYKSVRSIPIKEILKQFKLGLSKGYRYFYLEGRDLGSYGYDTDTTLVNLLEEIIENHRQESYKIFLYNISPNSLIELYPDLERVLASKKIFHLGSHIQSGSKRILKLMGKNLSIGKWVEVIKEIQKSFVKRI